MTNYWKEVKSNNAYCNVSVVENEIVGMKALKTLFPEGRKSVNILNLIMFSTSGIQGTYRTIESVMKEGSGEVTFLVIHPRIVSLKYGNCYPTTKEDFDFLKEIRQASWDILQSIGRHSSS